MANWEKFVRDVINKTILSGKFGDPYDSKGDRAREVQTVYLSSPENPTILRDRDLSDTVTSVATGLAEMLEPVDLETGLPNVGPTKAGTIVFKWSPSWFKTWLGESIKRHPNIKDIVSRIEREWEHLGGGATREVWGKGNVVAKMEYEPPPSFPGSRPNMVELASSLILRKNLPKTDELARLGSSGIIIPKPYAFVRERTSVPPYSILFSQRVPFEYELTTRGYPVLAALEETARRRGAFRGFTDLSTAIDARMFFDDAAHRGPGGVILNMGLLSREGAPKHVLFDLGSEPPMIGGQINRKLKDTILDTLDKSIREPVRKVYLMNVK